MKRRSNGAMILTLAIIFFYLSAVAAFANGVAIDGLSLSQTGTLQVDVPVTVTASATESNGQTLYYKFYYCANYGTGDYASTPWTVVQDYSTANSAEYSFSAVGDYIVVVRVVTEPNNEPEALPIIGQTVTVTTLASTTPQTNPIIGSWLYNPGDLAKSAILSIIDDTNYMFVVDGDPDDGGGRGMERGTYTWDSSSGVFNVSALSETAGDWGISYLNAMTVSLSGNTLNLNDSVEGLMQFIKIQ